MNFDFGILDFIQANMRSDFFDAVMPFITRLGDAGIIWILATLVLLAVPKSGNCRRGQPSSGSGLLQFAFKTFGGAHTPV